MSRTIDITETDGPGAHEVTEIGDAIVAIPRRTIDKLLVGFGVVAAVVFAVAGGLLTWGSNFSEDYVYDELSSQNIFFPPEEALREEGRDDLVEFAGQQVTTGEQAEAYASFIDGHLQNIADGQTYAEIDDRGAWAEVEAAREAGASEDEIAELEATAQQLTQQRDTLFKGETLRGLLLSSYAWSTIGRIAGIAATVAFVAAGLMVVLVVLGVVQVARNRA
ncbi:MAG: hypothetical protein GXY13_12840 [Acidimicrobiales bacterium]|nr:hypothetical protein [Acidimicrobiales bacterium]